MGRPSDRRRSARRPGKRERARVKKRSRTRVSIVSSAGIVTLKAGRKKWRENLRSKKSPFSLTHLLGNR